MLVTSSIPLVGAPLLPPQSLFTPRLIRPVPIWTRLGLSVLLLVGSTPISARSQAPSPEPQARISLAQLLLRVEAGYPRIGAANARVSGARAARRAAGVFPNPVIGFGLENVTLPGHSAALGMDREATATATIPLEFLYQRGARVRRADARLQSSEADGSIERQRVAIDAVHQYYAAALAQVELAAAEDLAVWVDSLVLYNRHRVSEGIGAEADLLRAELERDRVGAEVTAGQANLARTQADLGALYNDSAGSPATEPLHSVVAPDTPLSLPGATGSSRTPPAASQSSDGPDARAEVRAARARLTAAGANIGVARSMLVRDLSAMVGLKRSAGTTTLLTGLSIPVPIIDRNRGELAEARADREVAAFELAATERQVHAEIVGAAATARLLAGRVEALRGPADSTAAKGLHRVRYLARADEIRTISLGAYREGAVPLLQVLDAARSWSESRLTYYHTLYAQHESVAALLAAEGRDLFMVMPALAMLVPATSTEVRP